MTEAVDAILAASQRNNAHAGVTGALMFTDGFFAQVLEGSMAAVEQVFERIQLDDRHSEVQLLSFAPVEAATSAADRNSVITRRRAASTSPRPMATRWSRTCGDC